MSDKKTESSSFNDSALTKAYSESFSQNTESMTAQEEVRLLPLPKTSENLTVLQEHMQTLPVVESSAKVAHRASNEIKLKQAYNLYVKNFDIEEISRLVRIPVEQLSVFFQLQQEQLQEVVTRVNHKQYRTIQLERMQRLRKEAWKNFERSYDQKEKSMWWGRLLQLETQERHAMQDFGIVSAKSVTSVNVHNETNVHHETHTSNSQTNVNAIGNTMPIGVFGTSDGQHYMDALAAMVVAKQTGLKPEHVIDMRGSRLPPDQKPVGADVRLYSHEANQKAEQEEIEIVELPSRRSKYESDASTVSEYDGFKIDDYGNILYDDE